MYELKTYRNLLSWTRFTTSHFQLLYGDQKHLETGIWAPVPPTAGALETRATIAVPAKGAQIDPRLPRSVSSFGYVGKVGTVVPLYPVGLLVLAHL